MNYSSLTISSANKVREYKVFLDIKKCLDDKTSWYFDAGAGAGKTFALIQTIRLIISKEQKNLLRHRQKILCVTYTNAAANEVKERLGASSLVDVSTIHDCVWRLLAAHQKSLVQVHLKNLISELEQLKYSIDNETWAEKFRSLTDNNRIYVNEMMEEKKDYYYQHKQDNAGAFRTAFIDIDTCVPGILSNVANFKKYVDTVFKIKQYENAVLKITEQDKKYTKVRYDSRFNYDSLEKMRISHDTLLEYTKLLVEENDLLKQIFCDQYPYVLVDEYQDTNPLVIASLSAINEYAKQISHTFLVGYYGDVKQNIYEDGVGNQLPTLHKNLVRVEKVFNRRSSPEIISVANKLRNDGLVQESIYETFPESCISFYNSSIDRQSVIAMFVDKWEITKENKLHCLELTNERVAEQSGFSEIYNFFKNAPWYKFGRRFEYLREHVLSLDVNKLGVVQKIIFRILDFRNKASLSTTMLLDIFQEYYMKDINIVTLRTLVKKIQGIRGNTLKEYISNMFSLYKSGDEKYDKCIEFVVAEEEISSYDELKLFLLNYLYYSSEESIQEEIQESSINEVDTFFEISLSVFDLWYNFISDTSSGEVVYHTYHGTKGREFDNVILFMAAGFGRKRDYFSNLLKVLSNGNNENEAGTDLESARNLFYVAVTRATKNLCIIYPDEIEDQRSVMDVFGNIITEPELNQ